MTADTHRQFGLTALLMHVCLAGSTAQGRTRRTSQGPRGVFEGGAKGVAECLPFHVSACPQSLHLFLHLFSFLARSLIQFNSCTPAQGLIKPSHFPVHKRSKNRRQEEGRALFPITTCYLSECQSVRVSDSGLTTSVCPCVSVLMI